MPGWTVDGNDVVAVARTCREAFAHARGEHGPAFVEAVTYRWRGHVGHREDVDVGVKRTEDLAAWKQRDPIRRLADALTAAGIINGDSASREIAVEVADALRAAQDAPFPQASALRDLVYAGGAA